MTPDEHLDAILAFIDRALQTCAKRTPGEWETDPKAKLPAVFTTEGEFVSVDMTAEDARFIAWESMAFERSLRSTKAAIEGLRFLATEWQQVAEWTQVPKGVGGRNLWDCIRDIETQLTAIRAAWPIEKLK